MEMEGVEPSSELFPAKNLLQVLFALRQTVLSDNVAIRIEQSESPSSMYDTGDLPYERHEADGTRFRRMQEQECCRRKWLQMNLVLSSISLHLFVARTVYGETARLQPDFVRSKIRRIPSPPLSRRSFSKGGRSFALERSIDLSLRFAFFDGFALVALLFVSGKPDQYLNAIVRSIHL